MRNISEAARIDEMGLRVYRVQLGEDIPLSGLYYHEQQEEAFYVVDGQIRVETLGKEYVVSSGHFFIAEHKSSHRAFNHSSSDETAVVIGIGAPSVDDGYTYDKREVQMSNKKQRSQNTSNKWAPPQE